MSSAKLTGHDVTEQIRRALRGEIAVSLIGTCTWDEAFAADVSFRFGDWEVTFFNDCDEVDYCDRAEAPDGRVGDCDDWWSVRDSEGELLSPSSEPIDLLDEDEIDVLERLLKEAR